MFKIPDSSNFTLHDEPLSDQDPSESGWETISDSGSSERFDITDLPGWEYSPEVDNTRDYADDERLGLALKSYYLKLEAYETGKLEEKPLVDPIASEYDVDERWLESHIIADAESPTESKHDVAFLTPKDSGSGDLEPLPSPYPDYTYDERMKLASAVYYARLKVYEAGKGKKPCAAPIAREYGVKERTLQRHIRDPFIKTRKEQHVSMQALSEGQESAIVDRLVQLDGWNVRMDKQQVMELGNLIYGQREPGKQLGDHWYYSFRERHKNKLSSLDWGDKQRRRYPGI